MEGGGGDVIDWRLKAERTKSLWKEGNKLDGEEERRKTISA